jgi:DNA polymerase epsilon subunit 1
MAKLTSQTLLQSETNPGGTAAVDFYFIQDDGGTFKATIPYEPYFFLTCRVSRWVGFSFRGHR